MGQNSCSQEIEKEFFTNKTKSERKAISMKRLLKIVCLCLSVLLFCTACQTDASRNFSNEYDPTTDFNYNIEYNDIGLSYLTESPEGFFFLNEGYLYYMDKESLSPLPLCKKANCLHDAETDGNKLSNCEAYVSHGEGSVFYYDNAVYVVSSGMTGTDAKSYKMRDFIKKYSTDGTFLETFYTFPKGPQAIIRHRDMVYYTYMDVTVVGNGNTEGTFKLMSLSLKDKSEKELFVDDLVNGRLDKLFAYGKYLYVFRFGSTSLDDPDSYVEHTLVYDLETGTHQVVDADPEGRTPIPIPYENSLLYACFFNGYRDERNKTVYQVDLDGGNLREFFQGEASTFRLAWDGTYLYEDNRPLVYIAHLEPERIITIYNDKLEKCDTISFKDVGNNPEGIDFTQSNSDAPRISENHIFTMSYGYDADGRQGKYLICIDKDQIGTGKIKPYIIWHRKEINYYS